ncbi:helix-turn-helix domain-containing protein [Dyadobacter sp. CY261]|uniref:helix-turn-helix domain-containing protein n=1 Tax=Dyadobacter sp. CY261 TaxID=2907203 RepID=UPI001F2C0FDD|nr:helix-turn-helix domain-containing protein [Dyadobacter sp. CY261]MCF0074370.1 helix-turn-helix domain-containing protein [Dyadobacter sp. CY261]
MDLVFEKDIKDSFRITHLECTEKESPVPERLGYHRIVFLQEAAGEIEIDDVRFDLSGKSLFLLSKGQLCRLPERSLLTGYELSFGDCFWERAPDSASNCKAVLFNNAAENQRLPVSELAFVELNFLFESLNREFGAEDYVNKLDALAAYLKIIMIKIANINAEAGAGFDNHEKKLYRNFIELVSRKYREMHEVAEYADALNIPARRLSDICRRCAGKGAKEIINGQIVAEAKRSLQFSSQPVKEIAYQLHFSTPEQFSHFFKKNAMISPQDYRTRFVNFGR